MEFSLGLDSTMDQEEDEENAKANCGVAHEEMEHRVDGAEDMNRKVA